MSKIPSGGSNNFPVFVKSAKLFIDECPGIFYYGNNDKTEKRDYHENNREH